MTNYRTYLDKAITLVNNYNADAKAISEDLRIPNENKHELTIQKKKEYQPQVDNLKREALTAIGQRKAELQVRMKAAYQPAGDPNAAIAADNQAWGRMKAMLDAGVDPTAILADAESRGDKRTVRVMGDEYRYYQAAQQGNLQNVDSIDRAVSNSMYKLADQEYRVYSDELAEMDKIENHTWININAAAYALDTTHNEGAGAMLRSDGTVADFSEAA